MAPAPLEQQETETSGGGTGEGPAAPPPVPTLTILWHPVVDRVGERAPLPRLVSGASVHLSRLEPDFGHPGKSGLRPLEEIRLSRKPVLLTPGPRGGGVRILPAAAGRCQVDGKEVREPLSLDHRRLREGAVLTLGDRVVLLLHLGEAVAQAGEEGFGMVGQSPAMGALRRRIRQVSDLEVPIFLRGETGTGKELVARAIHRAGPRRTRPFHALNLAAVPPALAASELFGAARGAFTGAHRPRDGAFVMADGGTLFLDEVGEMPVELQVLLLRVLETGEVQPVGSDRCRPVDVRLIAAADSDLETAIADGRFRAPLLHRLSGFEIRTPPLKERREDFGRLLAHFLRRELQAVGESHRLAAGAGAEPVLPPPLVARLAALDWPGNVRQLRNAVRELVIGSRGGGKIEAGPQIRRLLERAPGEAEAGAGEGSDGEARRPIRRLAEVSEAELEATLEASRWRIQPAARELGLSRTSLYKLLERHPGIRRGKDLGRQEVKACFEACGGDVDAMAQRLKVPVGGLRSRLKQIGLISRRSR